jgi:alkylated DNA repair protein (DNA oxidative demethylase)
MDATFLFGGHKRTDRPARLPLRHGDVVVWGAEDRLRYHGVLPLKDDPHPVLGSQRINLTFRKAG